VILHLLSSVSTGAEDPEKEKTEAFALQITPYFSKKTRSFFLVL
jgi:hypothetical protein